MSQRAVPSLEDYRRKKPGYVSAIDTLPDEVRDQLLSSTVGHAPATRWLHDIGYTDITAQVVGNWRRSHGWRGE